MLVLKKGDLFAHRIAQESGLPYTEALFRGYRQGQKEVHIPECGLWAFLLQSFSLRIYEDLFDLLLIANALKQKGCRKISVLLPFFPYSRQDSKRYHSISLISKLMQAAGITELSTIDLHSSQAAKKISIPIRNIETSSLWKPYLTPSQSLIGPDKGSKERISASAYPNTTLFLNKKRSPKGICNISVKEGQTDIPLRCTLIDDIFDTGETLRAASQYLLSNGAQCVQACVTHFLNPDLDMGTYLKTAGLSRLWISDSALLPKEHEKISLVSTRSLCASHLRSLSDRFG